MLFYCRYEQGMDVLHLTLSSRISSTVNSANIAKMQLGRKKINCEGRLIPRSKRRGKTRVIRAMPSEMENCVQDGADYSGKCMISQSFCRTDAEEVAKLAEERFPRPDGKVCINDIGTVILMILARKGGKYARKA